MGSVTVFVYFNGEWDECSNFSGYTVFGLIVPLDSSYESLIGLIAHRIDKEPEKHNYIMHYQTKLQGNMVRISDDYSLSFYLELKRGETDKDIYPLCVELTELESLSADARIAGQTETDIDALHSLALVQPAFVLGEHFSLDLMDNNPTVEEMGNELTDYIKVPAEEEVEDSNMVITRPKTNEVAVGKVFRNKELLITTISLFSINKRFQFVVKKSDMKTYTIKCAEECCDRKLRPSVSGVLGNLKLRKMDQVQKCSVGTVLGVHRQACTLVIANCIKYRFLSSRRIYTPRNIMRDIQETYGMTISYDKAWRSRELAIEMIRGNKDDSYGNLPSYMHMFENANPGSYTRIETDDENRFLFSFVALGASIAGWMHCKPVIVVDGTFLTNKYGGTIFTACTQDANNNIFILAFGVGDGENNAWEWFLLRV